MCGVQSDTTWLIFYWPTYRDSIRRENGMIESLNLNYEHFRMKSVISNIPLWALLTPRGTVYTASLLLKALMGRQKTNGMCRLYRLWCVGTRLWLMWYNYPPTWLKRWFVEKANIREEGIKVHYLMRERPKTGLSLGLKQLKRLSHCSADPDSTGDPVNTEREGV